MCLHVSIGYSLWYLPHSNGASKYLYNGEWISSVTPIANSWLCVSLNLSLPVTFHVSVDLLTNTSTKAVYAVDNVVGETVEADMLTVFEFKIDAAQTNYVQLVVYVSEGTVIRNVDIQNDHCSGSTIR